MIVEIHSSYNFHHVSNIEEILEILSERLVLEHWTGILGICISN